MKTSINRTKLVWVLLIPVIGVGIYMLFLYFKNRRISFNATESTETDNSNKPTKVLPNFKKGQTVTINKGVNMRSTDAPHAVIRVTKNAESGWVLWNNPYLNTIAGIAGKWVVVTKNDIYHVVSVNYIS